MPRSINYAKKLKFLSQFSPGPLIPPLPPAFIQRNSIVYDTTDAAHDGPREIRRRKVCLRHLYAKQITSAARLCFRSRVPNPRPIA